MKLLTWLSNHFAFSSVGHVIAARITSENPDEGFKPSAGTVHELNFKSNKNVWGYFSVSASGGLHEFAGDYTVDGIPAFPREEGIRAAGKFPRGFQWGKCRKKLGRFSQFYSWYLIFLKKNLLKFLQIWKKIGIKNAIEREGESFSKFLRIFFFFWRKFGFFTFWTLFKV